MTAAGVVRLGLSWAHKTQRYAGPASFCGMFQGFVKVEYLYSTYLRRYVLLLPSSHAPALAYVRTPIGN